MASSVSSNSSTSDAQGELQGVLDKLSGVETELDHVRERIDALVQRQERLLEEKQELKTKADQLQTLCQRLETQRGDFQKSDFSWSAELHRLKKSVFGIQSLRQMQEQVMNTTMSGRDCLLVMPTGAGKSLCYQLPALLSKGVTLVVSPLVSLMEDQTLALEQLGVPVALLSASLPSEKLKAVNEALLDPEAPLRLLYVTPEKIAKSKRFMATLQKCYQKGRLSRIAIDEVHCCSQWGHDFRPDYKMLGVLKRQFPDVPVMGLTATASASVLEDVKSLLNLHACVVLRSTYNRANLFYQVRPKPPNEANFNQEIVQLLNGRFKGQSGIIYCISKKNTQTVASALRKCNIAAEPYHADLDADYRSAVHGRWKKGQTQVVVATIAFGMGIDKPDVRFVIHHSLSKSLENYYQESGRAGRDDKPAECLLYFQPADVFRQSSMVMVEQTGLEKLYAMVAYCIDHQRCRRRIQADHFDERWVGNKTQCNAMCDNCKDSLQVWDVQLNDYYKDLLQILEASGRKKERLTPLKLAEAWLARKPALNAEDASAALLSRRDCELILLHLLLEGYLKEDFHFTPYNTITYMLPGPKASAPAALGRPVIYKLRPAAPAAAAVAAAGGGGSTSGKKAQAPSTGSHGPSGATTVLAKKRKSQVTARGASAGGAAGSSKSSPGRTAGKQDKPAAPGAKRQSAQSKGTRDRPTSKKRRVDNSPEVVVIQ